MHVKLLPSGVQLFATLWTVADQAPLSMGFYKQGDWRGLPYPTPGDFAYPGVELRSLRSPVLADGFFTTSATSEVVPYPLLICILVGNVQFLTHSTFLVGWLVYLFFLRQ